MKIFARVLQARKALWTLKGIVRQKCKMPNYNYPKVLPVHCNYQSQGCARIFGMVKALRIMTEVNNRRIGKTR